jgi:hypothetical protein
LATDCMAIPGHIASTGCDFKLALILCKRFDRVEQNLLLAGFTVGSHRLDAPLCAVELLTILMPTTGKARRLASGRLVLTR